MTAHLAARTVPNRAIPSRAPIGAATGASATVGVAVERIVAWAFFAAAAVLFVLDAAVTIQVIAINPSIVEQNPIARWTLEAHVLAPYVLKSAIVAECAVVVAIVRSMDERWAGYVVGALMAVVGIVGISTAVSSLAG
jgi:hypothetical protein